MPERSCAAGAWAASSIGAATRNAASAVPITHRPKLEEVTGNAPMGRLTADFRANRQGWAENGLFAPPPQERRSRRSDRRLKTSMWQHRDRNRPPPVTYLDSSARRRLQAEPR